MSPSKIIFFLFVLNVQNVFLQKTPPLPPLVSVDSSSTSSLTVRLKPSPAAANDTTPPTGYTVHYRPEFGDWETVQVPSNTDTYTIENMYCGSRYQIYVTAYNSIGTGEAPVVLNARTSGSRPPVPRAADVMEVGSRSVTLHLKQWQDGGCPMSHFVVENKKKGAAVWNQISNAVKPSGDFVVMDLEPATCYVLRITAHNNAGFSVAEYEFATLTVTEDCSRAQHPLHGDVGEGQREPGQDVRPRVGRRRRGAPSASCTIDYECEECLPENMPMITSHRISNRSVTIPSGDLITFYCQKAKFFSYPHNNTVQAFCEDDQYRVIQDTALRHLLELGCQENIFEDVQHHVENCAAPLQGRSYQYHDAATSSVRHLAKVCFDQDRAIATHAHMTTATDNNLAMGRHSDQDSPLSLLGNFNQMFDTKTRGEAEKLFADDRRMNKRVQELLKHNHFNLAGQSLTSSQLLSGHYFIGQNMRAADFISNKLAMWKSVADGNMRNVHNDIRSLISGSRGSNHVDIHAGIHDVLTMRSRGQDVQIYLKPGRRFPIPKYIWNIIYDKNNAKAVALVTLNNPFIPVSEISKSVFCQSICSKLTWINELKRNQNFETPVYGLVFCCDVHEFALKVKGVPQDLLNSVAFGNEGLLTKIPGYN